MNDTALASVRVIVVVLISLHLAGAALGQIKQRTEGDCSPAVANVTGNVTVMCNIGGKLLRVPGFVGDFSRSSDLDKFESFVRSHVNAITYVEMRFDIESYAGHSANCEDYRAPGRDMCLEFRRPEWTAVQVDLRDAQIIQDQECGFQCIPCQPGDECAPCTNGFAQCSPCEHGFCEVKGFFIAKQARESQGYLFLFLQQLETKEVLMNPRYDAPD